MGFEITVPSQPIIDMPKEVSYKKPSVYGIGEKTWSQLEEDRLKAIKPGAAARTGATTMEDYLRAAAMGEKSYARDQAETDVRAVKAGLKSQVASGQWTPASRIAAGQAEGAATQNVRAGGEIAAQAEQQAAMSSYLTALGGEKALDSATLAGIEALAVKYRAMGLSDAEAQRKASMTYEADKLKRSALQTGLYQQEAETGMQWLSSIFGAEGTAVGAAVSDVNVKTGVSEASLAVPDPLEKEEKDDTSISSSSLARGLGGLGKTSTSSNPYGASLSKTMGLSMEASDTRAKEQARVEANIREMLDHLQAYSYNYKDPERFGYGRRVGVMAQDMEKSKLGDQLVGETPDHIKTIDYSPDKFNPMALAAMADINKRLSRLESSGRKK